MSGKIFELENPNQDIFIIEGTPGADDDDKRRADLGDSTDQHLQQLTGLGRHAYEETFEFGRNLFRLEESTFTRDDSLPDNEPLNRQIEKYADWILDPDTCKPESGRRFRDIPGTDLQMPWDSGLLRLVEDPDCPLASGRKGSTVLQTVPTPEVPDRDILDKTKLINQVAAILEEEEAAMTNEEDVVNHKVGLVPFADYEKFGQQSLKYWDIPRVTDSKFTYLGNCYEQFYDHIDEEHPEKHIITMALSILSNKDNWFEFTAAQRKEQWQKWNSRVQSQITADKKNKKRPPRKWDAATLHEDYMGYINYILELQEDITPHTLCELQQLTENLCAETHTDPMDLARNTLERLDDFRAKNYHTVSKLRSRFGVRVASRYSNRPQSPVLCFFDDEELRISNLAPEARAQAVNQFGSWLFKNHKADMERYHWERYRQLKRKYAPQVMVAGINVNSAGKDEIQKALNITSAEANTLYWEERPTRKYTLIEDTEDGWVAKTFSRPYTQFDRRVVSSIAQVAKLLNTTVGDLSTINTRNSVRKWLENIDEMSPVIREAADLIQRGFIAACVAQDSHVFRAVTTPLVKLELSKRGDKTEWKEIWCYYRVIRAKIATLFKGMVK